MKINPKTVRTVRKKNILSPKKTVHRISKPVSSFRKKTYASKKRGTDLYENSGNRKFASELKASYHPFYTELLRMRRKFTATVGIFTRSFGKKYESQIAGPNVLRDVFKSSSYVSNELLKTHHDKFLKAAQEGRADIISCILNDTNDSKVFQTPQSSTLNEAGTPMAIALEDAAENKHLPTLNMLLKSPQSAALTSEEIGNGLWHGVENENMSIVNSLLESPQAAALRNTDLKDSLSIAAKKGLLPFVNRLLISPQSAALDSEDMGDLLWDAAENGDIQVINKLLEPRQGIMLTNESIKAAKRAAERRGKASAVQLLHAKITQGV